MFQTSDDINLDEEFLNDAFDVPFPNSESNKRNSDPLTDQPIKKVCTNDNATENILSIIKSKSQTNFLKPNPVVNKSVTHEKRRVVQRKFPGPAGILPEQKQHINIKSLEEHEKSTNSKTEPDEIVCSQLSEDIFKKEPWLKMLSDWSAVSNRLSLPNKYTISWTKSKAVAKKLIGQKTPFLAAVIQTIDCSSKDPMILLKDQTGEIQATLLHEVWEEYCDYLTSGSVIVLKQVGVLSTLKKQYLAITLNNIVTIYTETEYEETGISVETTNVQDLSIEEFIKTIEDIKNNYTAQKILQKLQPSSNNPYFKQPNQQKSPEITTKPTIKNNKIIETTTPNKFSFKSFSNKTNEPNKENLSKVNTCTTSTDNSVKSTDEELILTQMLEGVDTDSLFEDF